MEAKLENGQEALSINYWNTPPTWDGVPAAIALIGRQMSGLNQQIEDLKRRTLEPLPASLSEYGGINLFCEVTGYAKQTGYNLVSRDEVPFEKVRGRIRFSRSNLREWMEREKGKEQIHSEVDDFLGSRKNPKKKTSTTTTK